MLTLSCAFYLLCRSIYGGSVCKAGEHAPELAVRQHPPHWHRGPAGLLSSAPPTLLPAQHQYGLPAQHQVPDPGILHHSRIVFWRTSRGKSFCICTKSDYGLWFLVSRAALITYNPLYFCASFSSKSMSPTIHLHKSLSIYVSILRLCVMIQLAGGTESHVLPNCSKHEVRNATAGTDFIQGTTYRGPHFPHKWAVTTVLTILNTRRDSGRHSHFSFGKVAL